MLTLLADRADQQLVGYGDFLQESGYDVIAAEGSEATIHEANEASPDVVLVHLREPVLEMLELCRQIRAGAQTRRVSIIVLTDIDDVHVRDRIIGAGAAMIVRTPVSYPALFLRVRRMLAAKHRVPKHQRRVIGSLGA
jgi:two-component system phosphate regulon response regulator PhoB